MTDLWCMMLFVPIDSEVYMYQVYIFFHYFHKPRFTKAIFHMFYAYNGMRNV